MYTYISPNLTISQHLTAPVLSHITSYLDECSNLLTDHPASILLATFSSSHNVQLILLNLLLLNSKLLAFHLAQNKSDPYNGL